MIRVSLSYIYELASKLDALTRLPSVETRYGDIFVDLFVADAAIKGMYGQTLYAPYLRSSAQLAGELVEEIKRQGENPGGMERMLQTYELYGIKDIASRFRTAFLAELGVLHSYFVTQKGGFDTMSLLAFGENLWPSDLVAKVPESVFDVRDGPDLDGEGLAALVALVCTDPSGLAAHL